MITQRLLPADESWKFTCKKCGGREIVVNHYWDILVGSARERWREWGLLNENHRINYDESELVETVFEEWFEDEIDPNEINPHIGREEDPDSHEFYVNCTDCDGKIEFGWSHPDRGGRIWPAECSDFNPWKSWPEPRYRDSWITKGWLRPGAE